jgi:lipid-binding SYLF domain-containing protein
MIRKLMLWTIAFLLLALAGTPLSAGQLFSHRRELNTAEASIEVVQALSANPVRCIPPALLHESVGVAIFPHIVKAGLVVDHRFGKGVVLVRQPDGNWSDPVFVTVESTGVGLQAGVEATDLVLVFKNSKSLDHILQGKGKLTLGTDASVAAGPVGREAERASDERLLKADVFSYSRSRGLFAGVSLEGSRVNLDLAAMETFYNLRGCRVEDVLGRRCVSVPAAEALKGEMFRIGVTPR